MDKVFFLIREGGVIHPTNDTDPPAIDAFDAWERERRRRLTEGLRKGRITAEQLQPQDARKLAGRAA